MKKIFILFFTVSLMMISAPKENADSRENIINHLDINYSYNIAESLTKFKTKEKLWVNSSYIKSVTSSSSSILTSNSRSIIGISFELFLEVLRSEI